MQSRASAAGTVASPEQMPTLMVALNKQLLQAGQHMLSSEVTQRSGLKDPANPRGSGL